MSYLVLARKWRPQTFDDVVGQEHVTRTLKNAITANRLAHAFIFNGPRGVGKTTMARILAKALNCQDGPTPAPCNICSQCKQITNGSSIDVLEIDGASHTGVDNVRDLTDGVQYRPAAGRFRVVIIDEVHMLSNAAFNALLKTLEEPPEHVKFIFATTEAHKILQTILSRCQRFDFKHISLLSLIQRLKYLAREEGFECEDAGLSLLAREARGSLRDAESLLDQVVAWGGNHVTENSVRDALGVVDRQTLFRTVDAVLTRDPSSVVSVVSQLYTLGHDPSRLYDDLLEHFHSLIVAKVSEDETAFVDVPEHEVSVIQKQSRLRSKEDLMRFFAILLETEEAVRRSKYTQMVVEIALVRMANLEPVIQIDEVLEKLEALQSRLKIDNEMPALDRGGKSRSVITVQEPTGITEPHRTLPRGQETVLSERPGAFNTAGEGDYIGPSGGGQSESPLTKQPAPSPHSAVDQLEEGKQWEGFLRAVQEAKISLFFALKSGSLLSISDARIVIGVDKEPYLKELSRSENKAILESTASSFFGKNFVVDIRKSGGGTDGEGPNSKLDEKRAVADNDKDMAVKTVLDVLGGKISESRAPRSGGS